MSADQPLTGDELATIRARAEAATPGPWTLDGHPHDGRVWVNAPTERHLIAMHGFPVNAEHVAGMDPSTTLRLVAEIERLRAQAVDMVPGRWWRVLEADGDLWMETSSEQEARDSMTNDAKAATIERLWIFPREAGEWRAVE